MYGIMILYIRMKVNTVGKKFSEVERAYIAGFLDGDGCIMATIEKHSEKKFGFRVRVTLKISQSDRKIIDWFYSKSGVGYVQKNRTTHDWIVRDQSVVREIIQLLLPYLKVKKQQAQNAIIILNSKIISQQDLLRIARLADALSRLNTRSKGRRKNFAAMIQEDFSRND